MEEEIKVNLADNNDEDTISFFNLLDPALWGKLKDEYSNPENEKSLGELVQELLGA